MNGAVVLISEIISASISSVGTILTILMQMLRDVGAAVCHVTEIFTVWWQPLIKLSDCLSSIILMK